MDGVKLFIKNEKELATLIQMIRIYSQNIAMELGMEKCAMMIMKMDTATRVQILDETDCISHSTNTLGKGMNPIILLPAMGK